MKRQELAKSSGGSGGDAQRNIGKYIYSDTLLRITYNVFYGTPSLIDILFAVGFDEVLNTWKRTIRQAKIKMNEFCLIEEDVIYSNRNLRALYDTIKALKDKSGELDPLSVLGG